MNTRQMEIFVNIVRYGNFSNAAKKMYLSQPAISANIDMLEKEIGCRLFIRQKRTAALTDKGRIFYEYCIKVLTLTEENFAALRDDAPLGGTINVISSYVPGVYLLPEFIKEFTAVNDNIDYMVSIKNSKEALEGVLNSNYDIGFTGSTTKNDAIAQKKIFTDNMVLIAPKEEPFLSLPQSIDVDEIRNMTFVMRSTGSATLSLTEKALTKAGILMKNLKVIAEFDSGEAVVQAVTQGLGVSIISRICAVNNPGVLLFDINSVAMKRDFYAIILNSGHVSLKAQRFFEFLPEVASERN